MKKAMTTQTSNPGASDETEYSVVDWMYQAMVHQGKFTTNNNFVISEEKLDKIIDLALSKFEKQITAAYEAGEFNQGCNGDAIKYLNQTYGGAK